MKNDQMEDRGIVGSIVWPCVWRLLATASVTHFRGEQMSAPKENRK